MNPLSIPENTDNFPKDIGAVFSKIVKFMSDPSKQKFSCLFLSVGILLKSHVCIMSIMADALKTSPFSVHVASTFTFDNPKKRRKQSFCNMFSLILFYCK